MSQSQGYGLICIAWLAVVVGVVWSLPWSEKARYDAQRPQVVCTEGAP